MIERFHPWSIALYRLTDSNAHMFLDDVDSEGALDSNGVFGPLFQNKTVANLGLSESLFAERYTHIVDGEIHGEKKIPVGCVLKPASGWQGDGVEFHFNGIDAAEMQRLAGTGDEFLIEQILPPHVYSMQVWPYSFNTLRFLTFYDEGKARIAAVVHKWGTKASGELDNFSKGGLTTFVSGGTMGYTFEDFSPMSMRWGLDGKRRGSDRFPMYDHAYRFERHPESDNQIFGKRIPFWDEAQHMVLDSAKRLYDGGFLRYLGLDVMITPTGPKIIEINPDPGVHLIQVHKPLLSNPEFKRFVDRWTH